MTASLAQTIAALRENQAVLRARGVLHASVFGSVARGEARDGSDIDILVELEPQKACGVYEFVRLQLDIGKLIGGRVDLAERNALKPFVRESAMQDAVHAF